ncbi:YggT family protein [Bordetella sp. FB-8]|uniref:YggT family protein n=1 Tax=Bordetella sp. FB-8 TaxID=1159870 RepID=UPI000363613A|nr:YggT family protein [Bordetella sp. FB-8]
MFGEIARFLLDIIFTLFGAALILRIWMHAVRLHPLNPVTRGVQQASNWLVLPLRKLIPATGAVDWTSLVALWLAALVYLVLAWLLSVGALIPPALLPSLLAAALLMALKWALNLIVWMTLAQAVLSWVNPLSPLMPILHTLTRPLLDPIRQILPRTGGIDFAPLLLLVIAQVLLMVLTRAGYGILGI